MREGCWLKKYLKWSASWHQLFDPERASWSVQGSSDCKLKKVPPAMYQLSGIRSLGVTRVKPGNLPGHYKFRFCHVGEGSTQGRWCLCVGYVGKGFYTIKMETVPPFLALNPNTLFFLVCLWSLYSHCPTAGAQGEYLWVSLYVNPLRGYLGSSSLLFYLNNQVLHCSSQPDVVGKSFSSTSTPSWGDQ